MRTTEAGPASVPPGEQSGQQGIGAIRQYCHYLLCNLRWLAVVLTTVRMQPGQILGRTEDSQASNLLG
jgi:hypothetical protein